MVLGSPKNEEHASVVVMCGYDLLARAVHDTLAEAGFCVEFVNSVAAATPSPKSDVLILDDAAAGLSDSLLQMHSLSTTRHILIDSICTPQRVLRAVRLGAAAYLYLGDHLAERLVGAVIDVLEGGTYYSPTAAAALAEAQYLNNQVLPRINAYHRAVLRRMAQHHPAGQIANDLGRSTQAIYQVQCYLRSLFDVDTNGELLDHAAEWGLTSCSA